MWKIAVLLICLWGNSSASPLGLKRNMPIMPQRTEAVPLITTEATANGDPNEMVIMSSLSLPSNATSIRADITDGFSCENKTYGYYADVDNECQIFHVCLPVTYADGKENTFRWSFICPEETIFSQDSFTCMRPDDMTITCEESYQYYELNRNFGMMTSSEDKENNSEATGETVESNETTLEAAAEPAPAKPIVQEEQEKVIGQYKPVNVQKHNRRKPSTPYATQRKPAISYPLRKMPQLETQIHESPAIPVSEDTKPVEEEKLKPAIQKLSRRPVVTNFFKDKIQNSNPESVEATRTELFNNLRKRPAVFNKKPAAQLEEEQSKIEQEQQNFSPVASDVSITNIKTQMADSHAEASETNQAVVGPEDVNNAFQTMEEPEEVLEAFEEIPAVISEAVETSNVEEEAASNEENVLILNAEEVEKSSSDNDPQIVEDEQSAEEIQETDEAIQETQKLNIPDEVTKTVEEMQAAEETQVIDENETVLETQSEEETSENHSLLRTSAEESQNVDVSQIMQEVAEKIPAVEESKINEELKADEETQNVLVGQAAEEIKIPEDTEDTQKSSEFSEVAEDIKTNEESQAAMEFQAAEETKETAAENTEIVEDTQAASAEEEISEVQQSLRTSAEEIPNSETKTETEKGSEFSEVAEDIKTNEESQAAVEFQAAEETKETASENTEIVEDTQAASAEEEISEVQQSLRTSAEEIPNSETKTETEIGEESPLVETQKVEESVDLGQVYTVDGSQVVEVDPSTKETEESKLVSLESQMVGENQVAQELLNVEETNESEEPVPAAETHGAEVQISAEISLAVEEPQPITGNVEDSTILEETELTELSKSAEENVEPEPALVIKDSEPEKAENIAEPAAISEENAEENISLQTIEQMESEKPAEVSESLQATEEMSQPNPIVEQMYADMGMDKKSGGNLKPVDPAMAHEAEQLIVDFINTLRKNDFANEAPGVYLEQHSAEEKHSHEDVAATQEVANVENSLDDEEEKMYKEDDESNESYEMYVIEDNRDEMQDMPVDEEHKEESVAKAEVNENREEDNILKAMEPHKFLETAGETTNLPQEMYQIPVQVITSPVQHLPVGDETSQESDLKPAELTASTEEVVPDELPAADMPKDDYKPLSIDDIVELVKERLDHMPKEEMEAPMQLEQVLVEAQKEKYSETKVEDQTPVEVDVQQPTSHSKENVMPIYQRTVVQPVHMESGVQTEALDQSQNVDQSDAVADFQEKPKRSYTSRSLLSPKMDARKRRFLFKADLS